MQASELRIGNFITVNRFGIDIVAKIENGKDIDDIDASKDKPIPLTEEWLLKFGFEWQ